MTVVTPGSGMGTGPWSRRNTQLIMDKSRYTDDISYTWPVAWLCVALRRKGASPAVSTRPHKRLPSVRLVPHGG